MNSEYCGPPPCNNFDFSVGQGQGHGVVQIKGLVTTIIYAKYQCSIFNTSEDMSQVKVFMPPA